MPYAAILPRASLRDKKVGVEAVFVADKHIGTTQRYIELNDEVLKTAIELA